MAQPEIFDAIVIGAGQAGPPLAARLTGAGMRVALVERKLFGGTCVNTGCIPSKTLIASAHAAHMARRAADFGVVAGGPVSVDMKAVKARKDEVSGKSRTGVEQWLKTMPNCTVFEQHASFVSPREVKAGEHTLRASKIFINTGARAIVPELPGLAATPYLTNSSIMAVDFLPEHLVILGGSYVGIEFAQMYRRFGSRVTLIQKGPRLIEREDEDVSTAIRDILVNEGIEVRLNARAERVDAGSASITVAVEGQPAVRGSHLLLAVGRRPNTDDLGLEKAGVRTNSHGFIEVDRHLRTSAEGIWALGECNGQGAFTHTSYNDFEIAADNLLDGGGRSLDDRIVAYGLYTDPPLGRAGQTAAEVRRSGRKALAAQRPMTRVGRAVEKGETQGFMRVLVDAESKQILGASILGPGGDEAIHCILDVMYAKQPFTTLRNAMHIHPTVCELIPTILGELKPLE